MPGSFADIPKSLLGEIKALEEMLTVPTAKLKQITDHFVKELEKGMSQQCAQCPDVPANILLQVSVLRVAALYVNLGICHR